MKKDKKKNEKIEGLKAFINKHYILTKEDKGFEPSAIREPLKVATDIGAVGVGTVGGLLPNKVGLFLGLGLLITGRLMKDKTGLLGIVGSSMIGYSVAMAKESSESEETISGLTLGAVKEDVKAKFSRLKENWLHATYLNKIMGDKDQGEESTENTDESIGSIGASDLSALDEIERVVEESVVNTAIKSIQEQEDEDQPLFVDFKDDFESDFETEENQPIEMEQINGFDDEFDHYTMATM